MTNSLKDEITKKMETIMIGSIASIENNFGFLFGHHKNRLSDKEKELRKIFLQIRKEILDLGNHNINEAQKKIDQYKTKGPYYTYKWEK